MGNLYSPGKSLQENTRHQREGNFQAKCAMSKPKQGGTKEMFKAKNSRKNDQLKGVVEKKSFWVLTRKRKLIEWR